MAVFRHQQTCNGDSLIVIGNLTGVLMLGLVGFD
jgi:hypothetical protein